MYIIVNDRIMRWAITTCFDKLAMHGWNVESPTLDTLCGSPYRLIHYIIIRVYMYLKNDCKLSNQRFKYYNKDINTDDAIQY